MKPATLSAFVTLALVNSVMAQTAERKDFVSDASHIVGTYRPENVEHSPQAMADAAQKFLASLDKPQLEKAHHALDSDERRAWTNVPARPGTGGVRLGELNANQVRAFCDMLAALLSQHGYEQMCHIMLADDQLLNGRPRRGIGTEDFYVVVFGAPNRESPWAFQLDGHHVGLNVALEGNKISLSPSFIGTQPESFTIAAKTYRPLAGNIDDAFALVNSLNESQAVEAIVGERRGRIASGPGTDGEVPDLNGVSCATFDAKQKQLLLSLISQWVNVLPPEQAKLQMSELEEELGQMQFAWRGDQEAGSDVSYSIQGPSLIIEYACQDLGGDPLNHLHSMYRDPTNEYGGQL